MMLRRILLFLLLALGAGEGFAQGLSLDFSSLPRGCGLNVWGGSLHADGQGNGINPGLGLKCGLGEDAGLYAGVNYIARNSQSQGRRGPESRWATAVGIGYEHPVAWVFGKTVLLGGELDYVWYQTRRGEVTKRLAPIAAVVIREERNWDLNFGLPAMVPHLLWKAGVMEKKVSGPLDEVLVFVRIHF